MAYANLVLQACSTKIEFFCRMRDFICKRNGTYDYSTAGIGWTLHDAVYAVDEDNPAVNDYFVIYSAGESTDEDMYFKVAWIADVLKIQGYQYWNNSTHAGVKVYNTANNLDIDDTGSYGLSVYGDMDFVAVIEYSNSTNDSLVHFGKLTAAAFDETVGTSAGAESSGSGVTVTLDAVPSDWSVGDNVYIRDTANIEIVTIDGISGNDVTVDLVASYLAGFKMQKEINYGCNSSLTALTFVTMVGRNNVTGLSLAPYHAAFQVQTDPDFINDVYVGPPIHMAAAGGYYGQLPNMGYVSSTGLTEHDLLTGSSDDYRYYKYGTNQYLLLREV